ncbi:MAG: hypothetical protein WBG50_14010 [Desulfomonilaceae bacterium]
MQEVFRGQRVQFLQRLDTFGVENLLKLLFPNSFDEHEHLNLSESNARDSFLRYLMVIRHALPPIVPMVQKLSIERKAGATRRSSIARSPASVRLTGEANDASRERVLQAHNHRYLQASPTAGPSLLQAAAASRNAEMADGVRGCSTLP